jgi:hypothetical protein
MAGAAAIGSVTTQLPSLADGGTVARDLAKGALTALRRRGLQASANRLASAEYRNLLASQLPGSRIEVYSDTAIGARLHDIVTSGGTAIEVKIGTQKLNAGTIVQGFKDVLAPQRNKDINAAVWHFRDPDLVDKKLLNFLDSLGIPVIEDITTLP